MTFKDIERFWHNELASIYDDREALNMFYWALEDTSGISRIDFLSLRLDPVPVEVEDALLHVLNELKKGHPYQYVIGFTYFGDLKLKTTPAALIPRPETEELIYWIADCYDSNQQLKIEDYCTGTGCIALSLKSRFPNAQVFASDISDEALDLARENSQSTGLEITVRKENVLEPKREESLDILVSNPPYIPIRERSSMISRVTEFEPGLALFVPNEDPLLFYRKLGEIGLKRLVSGGNVFFELHEDFAMETKDLIENMGYSNVELSKDLQEKWRMLRAVKP